MSPRKQILLALRIPRLASLISETLLGRTELRLAGVVDPTINPGFEMWRRHIDVVLIGADELLRLHSTASQDFIALSRMGVVVLIEEHQFLEVVSRFGSEFPLVLILEQDPLLGDRLALSLEGYFSVPGAVLPRLFGNELRRKIASRLTANERRVLALIGCGMSNRDIAGAAGLSDGQVKALVRTVGRKLCFRSRTEIAVFAAALGLDQLPVSPVADIATATQSSQKK
jgi:DNA-binding CsgD family transcriptional regulator